MEIPLIAGAYRGISDDINAQEALNFIPFFDEQANRWVMMSRPGTRYDDDDVIYAFYPIRGMEQMGGNLWVAAGNRIYKHEPDGTSTNKGTLTTATGFVHFAVGDGEKLMFVDGTDGYTIVSDTFAKITDADFPATPGSCCYIDGYYIVQNDGTGDFYISALDDPTSWSATDKATAEQSPDNLINVINNRGDLWLAGERGIEVWWNSGNADFPFEQIRGSVLPVGIGAQASPAIYNDTLYFLDHRGVVRAATGAQARRISTSHVEYQINQYSTYADAIGFIIPFEGHVYYILNFITGGKSWCFDITTNMWCLWSTYANEALFEAISYQFFNGRHLIGESSVGTVLDLDSSVHQSIEYTPTGTGTTMSRKIVTRPIEVDKRYLLHHSFEINLETGNDEIAISLKWSDDKGKTWSTGSTITIAQSNYVGSVIWRRLGISKSRIYKIECSSNAKIVIDGMAHAEITVTNRR